MIYHGVKSEEAVLMRINSVPRSVAENLGNMFRTEVGGDAQKANIQNAREYLKNLNNSDWDQVKPKSSQLNGAEYKEIWKLLSGE